MTKVDRPKMRAPKRGGTVRCSRCSELGHNARSCAKPGTEAGTSAAPGATGATAPPARVRRPGRKPRKGSTETWQEFHDAAGSYMKLEIRSSRRVPFGIAMTHKPPKGSPMRGLVEACGSEKDAIRALERQISAAVELGWRVGKAPVQLMELPKPLAAPLPRGFTRRPRS